MKQSSSQQTIILILILLVGASAYVTFLRKPVKTKGEESLINETELNGEQFLNHSVKIGLIAAKAETYSIYKTYAKEIIQKDMNNYSSCVGSNITFIIDVRDAQGQAAVHLDHVMDMKEKGVNLIIGGMWSSQACASLSYCNDNNIILFSPSSGTPLISLPNDNLFRLSIVDPKEAVVLTDILMDHGVQALIVIQRADSWADGIYNKFVNIFEENGGTVVERIRYPAFEPNGTSVLSQAERAAFEAVGIYGWDKVAVELLGFGEAAGFLAKLDGYPVLYNLTWYGSTASFNLPQIFENSTKQAEKIKLISIYPILPDSKLCDDLTLRFLNFTGQVLDYSYACTYDIAMIYAKTVTKVNDLETKILKKGIQNLCLNYTGVTGSCRLDEADDRASAYFGIYEYGHRDISFGCWIVGEYTDTGLLKWDK